jgi:ABC-type sugar transport system permease subunit
MRFVLTNRTNQNQDRKTGLRMSSLQRRRILQDWLFISPQLLIFILLTIVPLFVAIPILFTDMASFTDPQVNPVGFSNFTALFTDPSVQRDYLPALQRTIVFVILNYTTVYIFGLSLALLMYEIGSKVAFSPLFTCRSCSLGWQLAMWLSCFSPGRPERQTCYCWN